MVHIGLTASMHPTGLIPRLRPAPRFLLVPRLRLIPSEVEGGRPGGCACRSWFGFARHEGGVYPTQLPAMAGSAAWM